MPCCGLRDESIAIGPGTDTIEELCFQIENSAKIFGVPLSNGVLKVVLTNILFETGIDFEDEIDVLIECLVDAGVIVEENFQDQISTIQ